MIIKNKDLYSLFDNKVEHYSDNTNKLKLYFNTPCIYILLNNKEVVYIGETTTLMSRISDHNTSKKIFDDFIFFIYKGTNRERITLESKLISYYRPVYNIRYSSSIKECYLKSFYKKVNILYRCNDIIQKNIIIKKDNINMDFYSWLYELKSCVSLLETQEGLNNALIYTTNGTFIKMLNTIYDKIINDKPIENIKFKEMWLKIIKLRSSLNFTIIYKAFKDI